MSHAGTSLLKRLLTHAPLHLADLRPHAVHESAASPNTCWALSFPQTMNHGRLHSPSPRTPVSGSNVHCWQAHFWFALTGCSSEGLPILRKHYTVHRSALYESRLEKKADVTRVSVEANIERRRHGLAQTLDDISSGRCACAIALGCLTMPSNNLGIPCWALPVTLVDGSDARCTALDFPWSGSVSK